MTADEGPDNDQVWTGNLVCQLAIQAFRNLPAHAIFSPRADLLEAALLPPGTLEPGAIKVLVWVYRYLDAKSDEAKILTTYARHRGRPAAISLREFVREWAWDGREYRSAEDKWRAFNRVRQRACCRIARGLRRDGVPVFTRLPAETQVIRKAKRTA
jgi:hypothetical protein